MPRPSSTRAPATRDQADAYRFGLRRLEAALVRGDPVPLHEQIRTQRRAAATAVALGVLGVAGCLLFALVAPNPEWSSQSVVVGERSGALYVVAHDPDRLVPVANLPAARLVLAALRSGRSSSADPASATPITVSDETLDTAPRTPTAAVSGAVAVRPDLAVAPRWALCDTVDAAERLHTTVVGGAAPASAGTDAVLVSDPAGTVWLVTEGRRHRVDTSDNGVRALLDLDVNRPRPGSAGLIAALPEGAPIVTPKVANRGRSGPPGIGGQVGDVLLTHTVDGAQRYLVTLADGVQDVPSDLAALLLAASSSGPREVSPAQATSAARADDLPVEQWPSLTPRVRQPREIPVVCWRWAADGAPGGEAWTGPALPLAPGVTPVDLAQADGGGDNLDQVAVGPGGMVAGAGGQTALVSATGVAYAIADAATASALGAAQPQPAPARVLQLLPQGPALDVADAGQAADVGANP